MLPLTTYILIIRASERDLVTGCEWQRHWGTSSSDFTQPYPCMQFELLPFTRRLALPWYTCPSVKICEDAELQVCHQIVVTSRTTPEHVENLGPPTRQSFCSFSRFYRHLQHNKCVWHSHPNTRQLPHLSCTFGATIEAASCKRASTKLTARKRGTPGRDGRPSAKTCLSFSG